MKATADTIRLIGGTLCLDFANTVVWTGPGMPLSGGGDVFDRPEALVAWGARLGVLGSTAANAEASELEAARTLRSTVHGIFAAIASDDPPRGPALELLHATYAEAVDRGRLSEREGSWPLAWSGEDPRSVRFAVATDAVDLLGDPERLARVRQCPGRNCGGLFIDRTGRRRWCSMEICGSREKMRRLYQRQRGSASGTTAIP